MRYIDEKVGKLKKSDIRRWVRAAQALYLERQRKDPTLREEFFRADHEYLVAWDIVRDKAEAFYEGRDQ